MQNLFALKWVMMWLPLKSSIEGWYLTLLPRSVWKRQFRSWNKRNSWIPGGWLLAVFMEVLWWNLWAWCFRWSVVSWKELLHPCEVKNNSRNEGWTILSFPDVRKQSVTDNKLLQHRMSNGSLTILIIPHLGPPAQEGWVNLGITEKTFLQTVFVRKLPSRMKGTCQCPASLKRVWKHRKD